jgi:hypothetical protein
MKVRLLLAPAGLVVGSTLPKVLVVVLLTCNSYAKYIQPTQPSQTRQDWQDLEVISFDLQGDPAKTVYHSYNRLIGEERL